MSELAFIAPWLVLLLVIVGIAVRSAAERRTFSRRCEQYVEHALRHYPMARCHCTPCHAFRLEMGWFL